MVLGVANERGLSVCTSSRYEKPGNAAPAFCGVHFPVNIEVLSMTPIFRMLAVAVVLPCSSVFAQEKKGAESFPDHTESFARTYFQNVRKATLTDDSLGRPRQGRPSVAIPSHDRFLTCRFCNSSVAGAMSRHEIGETLYFNHYHFRAIRSLPGTRMVRLAKPC
jgi:hypothetical protein